MNDGESREGDYDRVLHVKPLTALFVVDREEDWVAIARVLMAG